MAADNINIGEGTSAFLTPPHAVTGAAELGRDTKVNSQFGKSNKLVDTRHPEWKALSEEWRKFRLVYEGGSEFIDEFLFEYSKRELIEDYDTRKALTYNENHAGSILDIIRNAMMAKLPEVQRSGDPEWEDIVRSDVDMQKTSMNTFIGLEVLPLLLAQGKRFVGIDAPAAFDLKGIRTLAEDDTRPYIYSVNAEDVLSWNYDDEGLLRTVLMSEVVDVVDEATGLTAGTRKQFRYMRKLFPQEVDFVTGIEGGSTGGILVRSLDEEDKDILAPSILPLERIPLVEFNLVDSLLTDIANMQIALLQLASTDMSFLFRGNFPIYTEQFKEREAALKPQASRRRVQSLDEEISDRDRIVDVDERPNVREKGQTSGVGYMEGLERPGFIHPSPENLRASMEKQDALAKAMRVRVDLALVSMSIKALEQSGKSKLADRTGQEAGLMYIASILETGERQISNSMHEFLGSNAEFEIKYPEGFTLKSNEERQEEASKLRGLRSAVPSRTYSRIIDRRIAETMMRSVATPEEIMEAKREIDAAPYIDDDERRQKAITEDLRSGILSKETGSVLRGHEPGEADKALAELGMETDMSATGEVTILPPEEVNDDA